MRGRKSPVTIAGREDEFRTAWLVPSHSTDAVASQFGCSRQCCYVWAKNMGLPTRLELRKAAGLPGSGTVTPQTPRQTETDQLARLEALLAEEDDGGPPPVERGYCMVCGGECPPHKDGHDLCRGRHERHISAAA
jgi:hypothetical protein